MPQSRSHGPSRVALLDRACERTLGTYGQPAGVNEGCPAQETGSKNQFVFSTQRVTLRWHLRKLNRFLRHVHFQKLHFVLLQACSPFHPILIKQVFPSLSPSSKKGKS